MLKGAHNASNTPIGASAEHNLRYTMKSELHGASITLSKILFMKIKKIVENAIIVSMARIITARKASI